MGVVNHQWIEKQEDREGLPAFLSIDIMRRIFKSANVLL